jgi:hypothetical protein
VPLSIKANLAADLNRSANDCLFKSTRPLCTAPRLSGGGACRGR